VGRTLTRANNMFLSPREMLFHCESHNGRKGLFVMWEPTGHKPTHHPPFCLIFFFFFFSLSLSLPPFLAHQCNNIILLLLHNAKMTTLLHSQRFHILISTILLNVGIRLLLGAFSTPTFNTTERVYCVSPPTHTHTTLHLSMCNKKTEKC